MDIIFKNNYVDLQEFIETITYQVVRDMKLNDIVDEVEVDEYGIVIMFQDASEDLELDFNTEYSYREYWNKNTESYNLVKLATDISQLVADKYTSEIDYYDVLEPINYSRYKKPLEDYNEYLLLMLNELAYQMAIHVKRINNNELKNYDEMSIENNIEKIRVKFNNPFDETSVEYHLDTPDRYTINELYEIFAKGIRANFKNNNSEKLLQYLLEEDDI